VYQTGALIEWIERECVQGIKDVIQKGIGRLAKGRDGQEKRKEQGKMKESRRDERRAKKERTKRRQWMKIVCNVVSLRCNGQVVYGNGKTTGLNEKKGWIPVKCELSTKLIGARR